MDWRTMQIGAPPQEEAKQDGDHSTPFRLFTSLETAPFGRVLHQQVDMIILAIHLDELRLKVGAGPGTDGTQATDGVAIEYFAAIFRHKDPMDVHLKNAVHSVSNTVVIADRLRLL